MRMEVPLEASRQQVAPLPPPPPQGSWALPPKRSAVPRILLYVVILLVVGIAIFIGVRFIPGLFSEKAGEEASLVYWGLWEEESVIEPIISDFQREYPHIKVTYTKQAIKQYRETLTNRLAAEEGGPDMFRFHNTWVPMLRDYLAPVPGDVFTKEEFERTFYKVVQEDLGVGNSYVGIPLEIDTLALFINEDDFKALGLSPPKTWDELRTAARQLTVRDTEGRIQKAGVALGVFDNVDHASDILALMMLQNGVDLKNKVATSISQRGENLGEDVLRYYVDEFSKGDGKMWDDTLDPSTLAFAKGKLSMYFGYSWRVFDIKALNPALNFRVVPVPQLPDRNNVTFASYWVEGVSKKSRFQKEAFVFLKYLARAETMQKLFAEQSKLRLFGEPYSRVDLRDSLKDHRYVGPFLELANEAQSWYLASNTFDNGLNDRMIQYFGDAVRAVGKGISPRSALETLAKGVSVVSTQYGL